MILSVQRATVNKGPYTDDAIAQCESSVNCKVVQNPTTTDIQIDFSFVANLTKRDSQRTTSVTVGKNMLPFGTLDPGNDDGVYHQLFNLCSNTGGCDTTDQITFPTTYVQSSTKFTNGIQLSLKASGSYPNDGNLGGALVLAIQQAAAVAQSCQVKSGAVTITSGPEKGGQVPFSFNQCKAPTFIQAVTTTTIQGSKVMVGTMTGTVQPANPDDGLGTACSSIAGAGGSILGAVKALNPAVAALLGVLSAFCSSV
jgi:hypothetical protein